MVSISDILCYHTLIFEIARFEDPKSYPWTQQEVRYMMRYMKEHGEIRCIFFRIFIVTYPFLFNRDELFHQRVRIKTKAIDSRYSMCFRNQPGMIPVQFAVIIYPAD